MHTHRNKFCSLIVLLAVAFSLRAEEPPFERGAVLVRNELRIASTALRALAVAAHPDDEDGATLAYLRQNGVETHICFSTRGEGGQNEAGPEFGLELAAMRTREIEEAAAILGAKAWYLNLPDFGFSKSVEETLQVWNHDVALERMVRVIRQVKPHLIITNHDPNGADHGHHRTTGKILLEAVEAAAKDTAFPEQLKDKALSPWKVQRVFLRRFAGVGAVLTVDVSVRDALSGLSASEIGALSLSKHASQGMLRHLKPGERELRYFSVLYPEDEQQKFETLWDHLKLDPRENGFSFAAKLAERPASEITEEVAHLVGLEVEGMNSETPARHHLERALIEILGLKFQATATDSSVTSGEAATFSLRFVPANDVNVRLVKYSFNAESHWNAPDVKANPNPQAPADTRDITVSADEGAMLSTPFEQSYALRNEVRTPLIAEAHFEYRKDDVPIATVRMQTPVPLDLAPPFTFKLPQNPVLIFGDPGAGADRNEVPSIKLLSTCNRKLDAPIFVAGSAGPKPREGDKGLIQPFNLKGETVAWDFHPIIAGEDLIKGPVTVPMNIWDTQKYYDPPTVKVVRVPLTLPAHVRVALIKGVDDQTRAAFKRLIDSGIGFPLTVDTPSDDELASMDWKRYTAVLLDIRATQQRPIVRTLKDRFLSYMQEGGTVVCFYQKDFDWNDPAKNQPARGADFFRGTTGAGELAPYPIELSFNRVTHEDAPVRFLKEDHSLLLSPNHIWAKDFDGWVQERGAYFPAKWADNYSALLSCNDPGEKPLDGGLLAADVGKGAFIYTSYFWHRQLQAGVPGAYRMLVNLICYSRMKREQP